jgi:flavin reductase (DIM6/NTAB) family NADH-FMN oxidoreductase RutF
MMMMAVPSEIVQILLVAIVTVVVPLTINIESVYGLEQPIISSSTIRKTTTPPLLDVPVYSLATLNEDGSTNMNIVTYATPVATPPKRVWSLGLFQGTTTDENVRRTGQCILQLLTKDHTDLVAILGGTNGRDVDKQAACERLGFQWQSLEGDDNGISDDSIVSQIQVLPGCASYIQLDIQGGVVNAGSHHIAAFCEVVGMYTSFKDDDDGDVQVVEHLSTGYLRSLGIITPQGRVSDSALPVLQ